MEKNDIPKTIMNQILDRAHEYWGDDEGRRKSAVEDECEAYRKFTEFDFGEAAAEKAKITDYACDLAEDWEERLSFMEDEVEAYCEIAQMGTSDIPSAHILKLKVDASKKHPQSFVDQHEYISGGVEKFRYARELNHRIEPIKDVLIAMERIIGEECYNAKIQNYGSWGVWEGEGRSFRYPVCFIGDGSGLKTHNVSQELTAESLMTGHYKFGQNELNIFRALVKVVEMLENEYGFKIPSKTH